MTQWQIMKAVQIHTISKSSTKAKVLSQCLSGEDPDPLTVTRPGREPLRLGTDVWKYFKNSIVLFWDRVSYSPAWPWTSYAVKSDFGLIFLHLPHECWGGIIVLRHRAWFMQVLGLESRASWATCACFDEDRLSFPLWAWVGWGRSLWASLDVFCMSRIGNV